MACALPVPFCAQLTSRAIIVMSLTADRAWADAGCSRPLPGFWVLTNPRSTDAQQASSLFSSDHDF